MAGMRGGVRQGDVPLLRLELDCPLQNLRTDVDLRKVDFCARVSKAFYSLEFSEQVQHLRVMARDFWTR